MKLKEVKGNSLFDQNVQLNAPLAKSSLERSVTSCSLHQWMEFAKMEMVQ